MSCEHNLGGSLKAVPVSPIGFSKKSVQCALYEDRYLFEGDMVLDDGRNVALAESRELDPLGIGISGNGYRWRNATIPFRIHPDLTGIQNRILEAIQHWQQNTIITMPARTTERNFVTFIPGTGCSASVGCRGEEQFIWLSPDCQTGNIIHEIGHAVGLWHEQSREDRDRFVQIIWDNILPEQRHNFDQHIADGDDLGAYDYASIMHYGAHAFAINPTRPTIISPQPIGQRTGLSANDTVAVRDLYADTLWHSIRLSDGSWTQFGDVEYQVGQRRAFVKLNTALADEGLQVCGATRDGRLWHTIREGHGGWTRFGDVESQAGDRGTITDVSCASEGSGLHVCAVTADGHLWHSVRRADRSWIPFGDVEAQAGDRGAITSVSCAGGGELHVCAINADGRLWHSLRRGDGSWTQFGDVEGQAGDRGVMTSVSCAFGGGELHVCAINADGRLWHSLRRGDGSWTQFGDVEGQAGDRGVITSVSCAFGGGELHVCAINADSRLWHSLRRGDGSWTQFGDVEGQAGDRGLFRSCAVANSHGIVHVIGIAPG